MALLYPPDYKVRCAACALQIPSVEKRAVDGHVVCGECRAAYETDGYLMFLDNITGKMITIERPVQ